MQQEQQRFDIYAHVTSTIITLLENGTVPWRKPWTIGPPMNLLTRHSYTGINYVLLNALQYAEPYYLTFKQIQAVAGSVKVGEKGHLIVFRKAVDEADKENSAKTTRHFVWRYYYVFNIAQCRNIPTTLLPDPARVKTKKEPILECETVIEGYKTCPPIQHEKNYAYYLCSGDYINMPAPGSFRTMEGYYDTLFHELIHSTGHASRLNRKEITESHDEESEPYAIEELVAEIGACFLNSYCGIGIQNMDNNAAYIENWLTSLRNDKGFVIFASAQAQKAVDYILNVKRGVNQPETLPAENVGD